MSAISRRCQKWSAEEDLELRNECLNMIVSDIAKIHQRTQGAILSRLRKHAREYHSNGKSVEEIVELTRLNKDEVLNAISFIKPEPPTQPVDKKATINTELPTQPVDKKVTIKAELININKYLIKMTRSIKNIIDMLE